VARYGDVDAWELETCRVALAELDVEPDETTITLVESESR
jgi:hypothetical protein